MAYINADVQTLENTIRAGDLTIEQGQEVFAKCISQMGDAIEQDEGCIEATQKGIKGFEYALENLEEEESDLSKQIGDLRAEEREAFRTGNHSEELNARSLADYLAKQREELRTRIKELHEELDKLHEIKYGFEQQKSSDIHFLETLKVDKMEFDAVCENIRTENSELHRKCDLISSK